MNKWLQLKKDKTKLIPYIEIIVGIILLGFEVHDYCTLYSMNEVDAMYGGIVDFCKYKEDTYCPVFLWTILTTAGISYWINKKLYWILTQVFILLLLLKAIFPFYFIFIELSSIVLYILPTIYITLFIAIEAKLFKMKQIASTEISFRTKSVGTIIGLLCYILYFLLL